MNKLNLRIIILISVFLSLLCSVSFAEESVYLNKIILNGLQHESAEDVIKSIKTEQELLFEPNLITTIKETLSKYFAKKGYYFAQIELTDIVPGGKGKVDLVFSIVEGPKGKLSDLRFIGNRYFSKDKLLQLLSISDLKAISLNQLPEYQNNILSLYTSRGYLFAQVSLDSLISKGESFEAVYRIEEGQPFKAEKYKFSGNNVTRTKTILKIAGLTQTRLITPDIITQAEDNLLRKPFITECSITPVDARTLSIAVKEARMTRFEGVFGMATNPNNQKRNINGLFNIQFLNLWGTDRALSLFWKSLNSEYQLLELSFHESGIKDYPFAGDITFQRTRQDSSWVRMKTELQLYYNSLYHKLGTDLYSETLYPDTADTLSIEKTAYLKAGLFWEYQNSDYFANPSSGSAVKLKSGWVVSKTASRKKTVPVTEIDATQFIHVKGKIVIAAGIHYRELADSKAKPYECYKLGGFKSIRGYYEDEFSSWRLGWVNTEIRYLIDRDSRLFVLIDNGFIQTGPNKVKSDLTGVGTGISFKTKLGTMSLSYALSITDKHIARFSSGMLHAGLESSF